MGWFWKEGQRPNFESRRQRVKRMPLWPWMALGLAWLAFGIWRATSGGSAIQLIIPLIFVAFGIWLRFGPTPDGGQDRGAERARPTGSATSASVSEDGTSND